MMVTHAELMYYALVLLFAAKSGTLPSWNFWKYLVDFKGDVLHAWGPWTQIDEIYMEIKDAVAAAEQISTSPRDFRDL